MRLTVYGMKFCGLQGSAMAVVAARSLEEAWRLAAQFDEPGSSGFGRPDHVYVLPVPCGGEPRVLSHGVSSLAS